MGRILEIRPWPRYHAAGGKPVGLSRDHRVRQRQRRLSSGLTDAELRRLYPDRATFAQEERRRFGP
jgi:hypothetical protein